MNRLKSRKFWIVAVIVGAWTVKYLGLDFWVPSPDELKGATAIVEEIKNANLSNLPALVGGIYVFVQGYLDRRK